MNPSVGVTNHAVYANGSLAHDGSHYLEANTSSGGGSVYQDTSVNLGANASATASIWARLNPGTAAAGQRVELCVWDLNSLTNACDALSLTHDWQQLQATATMPSAATDIRTQVYLYGSGNMDFDGAVLGAPQTADAVYAASAGTAGSGPPAPTGSTTPSSSSTPASAPPSGTKPARRVVCTAPRLKHMTLAQAKRALHRAHCRVGKIRRPKRRRGHRALRVANQSVRPRTRHAAGYPIGVRLA
jgi:hypothetical protein